MTPHPHLSRVIFLNAHIRKLHPLALLFLLVTNLLFTGCQPKVMTITIAEAGESLQILQEGKDPFLAQVGQTLQVGDILLVPPGETMKLELSDGSLVRLSGGSILQLLALDQEGQAARFHLYRGAAWIILDGDEIEIQTSSGNALVRGSYMSVSVEDPLGVITEVTCLEGHCELSNEQGSTALGDGQSATVSFPQEAPAPAQAMDTDQYAAWSEASPEAVSLVGDKGGSASTAATTYDATNNFDLMAVPYGLNEVSGISCIDFQRHLGNTACFPIHLENNCHGGEDSPVGVWNWLFASTMPPHHSDTFAWPFYINVHPGGSYTGLLPVFTYSDVWAWSSEYSEAWAWLTWDGSELNIVNGKANSKHWVNQTYTASSSINVRMCPDEPAIPTEALTEPLRYDLQNNCPAGSSDPHANTVWHWSFEQVRGSTLNDPIHLYPLEITLAPGESASGELEPGIWIERDWTENGSVDNPESLRIGGFDQVRLCPDDPPLNQP